MSKEEVEDLKEEVNDFNRRRVAMWKACRDLADASREARLEMSLKNLDKPSPEKRRAATEAETEVIVKVLGFLGTHFPDMIIELGEDLYKAHYAGDKTQEGQG